MSKPGKGVKDFLGKPAPHGYIAGLGRGATGFVTRPDLGPSATPLNIPSNIAIPADEDDRFMDNPNEEGLLAANGPRGAEDEEADAIFAAIDAKMSERRRNKHRKIMDDSWQNTDPNDPFTLFASDKAKLRAVSAEEWANLPESGDFIAKRVKKGNLKERYTPVPDSVLVSSLSGGFGGESHENGSLMTKEEEQTDFRLLGTTREKVLGAKLDSMLQEDNSLITDEPEQYLAGLIDEKEKGAKIGDIKRAKTLLKAAINSNPTNPAAWIAAARLEEASGNLKQMKSLLADALEACPDSDDIWIEVVKASSSPSESSELLNKALIRLPKSAKLWSWAASGENDIIKSKAMLRRALEVNPDSSELWAKLIEKESDPNNIRLLLAKATDCCPHSLELWINLARMESHENARKVLNKARKLNPHSIEIWLAAARLEEAKNDPDGLVEKIINRAVDELEIRRNEWLMHAKQCCREQDFICARSIVKATSLVGIEESDAIDKWTLEASQFMAESETTMAANLLLLSIDKDDSRLDLWISLCKVEPSNSNFQKALEKHSTSSELWLLYSEWTGTAGPIEKGLELNPSSEVLWFALIKWTKKNSSPHEQLEKIYSEANEKCSSDRLALKYLKYLLRNGKDMEFEKSCDLFLQKYPKSSILWNFIAQIHPEKWDSALSACPTPEILSNAAFYLSALNPIRARTVLEKGRIQDPNNGHLWLASVELEGMLPSSSSQSRILLTRALQKCPTMPELWYEAIKIEAKPLKKAKIMEAIRRCGAESPLILLSLAELMESERNFSACKDYYDKAVFLDSNNVDIWRKFIQFVRKYDKDSYEEIMGRALAARPKDGRLWRQYRAVNPRQTYNECIGNYLQTNSSNL